MLWPNPTRTEASSILAAPPQLHLNCKYYSPPTPPPSHTTTTGPMSAPLFNASLISPTVSSSLPTGYTLRPLRKDDYSAFLEVLRVLTTVGDIAEADWGVRYDWMAARNDEYFILCITDDTGRVVAVGSLIVERKLYPLYPTSSNPHRVLTKRAFCEGQLETPR